MFEGVRFCVLDWQLSESLEGGCLSLVWEENRRNCAQTSQSSLRSQSSTKSSDASITENIPIEEIIHQNQKQRNLLHRLHSRPQFQISSIKHPNKLPNKCNCPQIPLIFFGGHVAISHYAEVRGLDFCVSSASVKHIQNEC